MKPAKPTSTVTTIARARPELRRVAVEARAERVAEALALVEEVVRRQAEERQHDEGTDAAEERADPHEQAEHEREQEPFTPAIGGEGLADVGLLAAR